MKNTKARLAIEALVMEEMGMKISRRARILTIGFWIILCTILAVVAVTFAFNVHDYSRSIELTVGLESTQGFLVEGLYAVLTVVILIRFANWSEPVEARRVRGKVNDAWKEAKRWGLIQLAADHIQGGETLDALRNIVKDLGVRIDTESQRVGLPTQDLTDLLTRMGIGLIEREARKRDHQVAEDAPVIEEILQAQRATA